MTTIGIVGSRRWTDERGFVHALNYLEFEIFHAIVNATRIVSGGAPGVDTLAARFAERNQLELVAYPVRREGFRTFTAAAHARNQQIADDLHTHHGILIAMPGPESKGTYDTIRRCRALGVQVIIQEAPQ